VDTSKNIYLTGMPGAGKTTLGRGLAEKMGRSFIDLDDVIEEQMNMTVSAIFSELGESQFRVAEKRALESVLHENNLVVAVGGGTPCFYENMKKMNQHGITLFLDPSIDVLTERLRDDFKVRPKLAASSSLGEVLLRTYLERKVYYGNAHYRLTNDNPAPEDILRLLEGKSNRQTGPGGL